MLNFIGRQNGTGTEYRYVTHGGSTLESRPPSPFPLPGNTPYRYLQQHITGCTQQPPTQQGYFVRNFVCGTGTMAYIVHMDGEKRCVATAFFCSAGVPDVRVRPLCGNRRAPPQGRWPHRLRHGQAHGVQGVRRLHDRPL